MKGSLAASMLADRRRPRERGLAGDVILTAVSDEEFAQRGLRGDRAAVRGGRRDRHRADRGGRRRRASWLRRAWRSSSHGVAAHGSRPELGVDAIAKMGTILTGIAGARPAAAVEPTHPPPRERQRARVADRGRSGVLELPGAVCPPARAAHHPRRDARGVRSPRSSPCSIAPPRPMRPFAPIFG